VIKDLLPWLKNIPGTKEEREREENNLRSEGQIE